MFLYIVKIVKAKKLLRNYYLQQRFPETDRMHSVSSVACIVNIDAFEDAERLFSFVNDLGIQAHQFSIIGYTKHPKKYKHSKIPLFSFKDFNWKLAVKEGNASAFLNREYDVLIHYFTKEKLPLLLLSVLSRAKIRFGFQRLDPHYNDIIFKVDTDDVPLFGSELVKYLKVLKKP